MADAAFGVGDRIEFVFDVDDGPDGLGDLALSWRLTGLEGQPPWSDLQIHDPDRNEVSATWRRADPGRWEVSLVATDPAQQRGEAVIRFSVGDLLGIEPGFRSVVEP